MANFKKVFNFREGVQVDDQTFVVNGSLVGIGTSTPTKFLDVRRDAAFSGLTTFTEVIVTAGASFETGVGKSVVISNFSFTGDSVVGGILTASSGIISYFGDGSQLSNLPTSQWVDVDTGIGVSSVYNGGNVGIATLVPQFQLQVGANPEQGFDGFAVNNGNVYVSGAMTAFRFVGDGALLTDLNANELTSGIVTQARIPRLELDKIPLIPDYKLEPNIQISGILTAQGGFIGSLTGNVEGDVISSGFSTFTDAEVTGSLTAVASTALSLQGTPDIRVGFVSANIIDAGIAFTVSRADITGDLAVGILTVTDGSVRVGTGGSIFNITDGAIGIGTTQPTSTMVLFQQEGTNLEILTETGAATLNLGGDLGIGNSTAELRQELLRLELSNYANGDFIYHLGREKAIGDVNGSFRWLRGDPAVEGMTLTKDGNLGVGITSPGRRLVVTGDSQLDGNVLINNGAEIINDVYVYGGLSYNSSSGIATAYDLDVLGDLEVTGVSSFIGEVIFPDGTNIYTSSGISTFNDLVVTGSLNLDQLTNFNYNTTSGITTVNDLVITGIASFTGSAAFNLNVTEGISTVRNLDVSGDLQVGGATTVQQFECASSIGICTFNEVDAAGVVGIRSDLFVVGTALSVTGITTFSDEVYFLTAVQLPDGSSIYDTSGISTFNNLDVGNTLQVGVGASIPQIDSDLIISGVTTIGAGLTVSDSEVAINTRLNVGLGTEIVNIGFATIQTKCALDMSSRIDIQAYFMPPVLTTAQRNLLDPLYAGAIIYNSSTNKHQGYNGSTWNDFY